MDKSLCALCVSAVNPVFFVMESDEDFQAFRRAR